MTDLISTVDAAKITGYTQQYISSLCQQGKVPGAVQIARTYVIPREWAVGIAALNAVTVSVKEAAERAGVTRMAITQAVKANRLKKINRRITIDSLNEYIEKRLRS